ncbi:MAG TPA: tol-pal system protein YbgF, partial [Sphingomonadales bacterium]|nr:tol-pal system protein YbgF [Sphingomonadales bacterium]
MTRFALSLFLIFSLALVQPALAQAPTDGAVLKARIDKIEQELRTLQRAAAQGRVTTTAGAATTADQTRLLADMEVRLGKLEAELRAITGSVEELSHRQAELERTLELFRQDVQMQLMDSAGGGASVSGGAAALVATPTPAEQEVFTDAAAEARAEENVRLRLPEGSVKEQYDFALSYLRKGDYTSAEQLFQAFLTLNPNHELAGNAQYWLGETFYVRQNYPEAAQAFLAGFQNYTQGAKGPDNLLKLGLSLAAMGQTNEAC